MEAALEAKDSRAAVEVWWLKVYFSMDDDWKCGS